MDKKQKERNVLNLIYRDDEYAQIVDSEEPDFNIRHKNSIDWFGVEITEFYYTESNARLRNISDYFIGLIEQEKYRHKKDRKELEVREMSIINGEGVNKGNVKGIVQELPTVEKYVEMITQRVSSKDAKLSGYNRSLAHVNLIIFDSELRIATVLIGEYYRHLYTEALKESLYKTGFRELFLITVIHENRWVYIPLKMTLLVANLYMFHRLLLDYFPEKTKVPPNGFMILFAKFMRYKTGNAFYREREGGIEVIWGNSGVALGKKCNSIVDYHDRPLPTDMTIPKLQGTIRFFTSSAFKTNSRKLYEKGTFSTELAFDVKGEVKLYAASDNSDVVQD